MMKTLKISALSLMMMTPLALAVSAADLDQPPPDLDSGFYLRSNHGVSFLSHHGNHRTGFMFGGGFGYRFNSNLHTDALVDWAGRYKIKGKHMSNTTLLGNLYFDVPTSTALTPYVGAGLGYGWANRTHSGKSKSGFAYAGMAGVTYDMTEHFKLDVGYRYRGISLTGANANENQINVGLIYKF